MKGWTIKKVINGADKYSYTFTAENNAQPGKEMRVMFLSFIFVIIKVVCKEYS